MNGGQKLINCLAISRLAPLPPYSATFCGCYGLQYKQQQQCNNTFAAQSNWRKTNWWKIKFSHRNVAQIEMQSGQSGLLKNFMIAFCTPPTPLPTSHRGLNAKPLPECVCVCVTHVRVAELIYECFYRMSAKKAKNCCAGRCLDPFHRSPPQRAVSLSRRSRRSFWRPL